MDQQARLACLMAAGGCCERCGASSGALEQHHVLSRRIRATRWLPQNAVCLCQPCHRWWHASPRRGLAWFVERFGQARLDLIRSLRRGA
jgi:5-methylcytosine-specific restriction endonuclease McrA